MYFSSIIKINCFFPITLSLNTDSTDQLSTVGSVNKSNITVQRCSSDTNESYESCSTGWTSNTQFKTERKFLCYKKESGYECGWRDVSISQTIRMKESISANGSYITPTQFYTIYPSGSIAVAAPGTKIENGTELTNKLPVGLGTTQGVYNYVLMVENLGEYYNSDELGRIWGAEDSVVSTTLKENSKCQANGALKYEVNIDGKNYFGDGVYNCAYKVNCPDCPIECEPDGCENIDCPNNDCPVDCDDCVYTNSNTDVNYRPITPDDLNPNDRELGKNWEFNDKNIKTGLELKAYATTKEIEDLGETIYDINFEIENNIIKINFIGNGFLHNMVRIIVAMLLEVGNNRLTIDALQQVMDNKNRKYAPKLAPANGLYLVSVEY